jgi:endonuclease/exonuclease/phosphatase family metal-dependent hydrolase
MTARDHKRQPDAGGDDRSESADKGAAPPVAARRRSWALAAVLVLLALMYWHASVRRPTPEAEANLTVPEWTGPQPRGFRLAVFNMRRGRGTDDRRDLPRAAKTVEGADVVVLNEVGGAPPFGGTDQARQLAEMADRSGLFFPSQRRYYRDYFGNGLLTRFPIAYWRRDNLVHTAGQADRHVVTTHLIVGTRKVTLLITHLEGTYDRDAQLRTVIEKFLQAPEPAILTGDFNTGSLNEQIVALLQGDTVDAIGNALGEEDPKKRIDWILARGLEVKSGGIVDHGASDHPCYWVELAFTE